MKLFNSHDIELRSTLSRIGSSPTMVIAIGAEALGRAIRLASNLEVPLRVSVEHIVTDTPGGAPLGTVSGTDDMSYWNTEMVDSLGISSDDLFELSKEARLNAIREFRAVSRLGFQAIPTNLVQQRAVCVYTSSNLDSHILRLSILHKRRPGMLILLNSPATSKTLNGDTLAPRISNPQSVASSVVGMGVAVTSAELEEPR